MKKRPCPSCGGNILKSELSENCGRCAWKRVRQQRIFFDYEAAEPESFDQEARLRLEEMDSHFWTVERRRLTTLLLHRIVDGEERGLELGCGTGNSLILLENRFQSVDAVDLYPGLLDAAQKKSHKTILYQGDVRFTGLSSETYDFILSLDVIEHVDPDEMLKEARRLAKVGSRMLISAPASPRLWSEVDEAAGHHCRYTVTRLREELLRNQWRPLGATHYQFLLYPVLWMNRRLSGSRASLRERNSGNMLNKILRGITHLEVSLFHRISLPYGASVFIWAEAF